MNSEEVIATFQEAMKQLAAAFAKAYRKIQCAFEEFMNSKGMKILKKYKRIQKQRVRANYKPVMRLNKLKVQTYYPVVKHVARRRP